MSALFEDKTIKTGEKKICIKKFHKKGLVIL